MYNPVPAASNYPKDYWWTSTRDSQIRLVWKVMATENKEEGFHNLLPREILPTADNNIHLEFALYSLRMKVRALMANQKLRCSDIHALGSQDKTDFSLRAQYLTFDRDATLYSLKCYRREVQLAVDWDPHVCFRDLPVWVHSSRCHKKLRFLTPGLRLLLNSSRPENCTNDNHTLQGYQAISGE